ncbi:unnamed protein product, partial [Symbiodinium sp. CCMP2456]
MAWDFSIDVSKPRKGPTTPSFSGDWRGGAALHQAPQPTSRRRRPAAAAVEERDSDEEAPADAAAQADKSQVNLVWDGEKGQLVPAPAAGTGVPATTAKASDSPEAAHATAESAAEAQGDPAQPAPVEDDDGEGEEEEEAAGDQEVDVEAESRAAFLSEASTPELIKQAVAVGGPLADATMDKWVLDQATKLYFKYDTPTQKMYCWNSSQGCMYHWKERGKMTFLWASPGSVGAPPPAKVQAAPTVDPGAKTTEAVEAAKTPAPEICDSASLWVTVIPPSVLASDFEDADAEAEEELELNAKAMGAVIGKGGKGIKEVEQATGVKSTSLDAKSSEGAQLRRLVLRGTRAQIAQAKSAVEQRIVMVLGAKAAEKVQKHWSSQLLEKKRTETGSEAAKSGVRGLSEFVLHHGLKAVMARRLAKLDAMLQRYTIRHFKPMKAKPANALRGYLASMFKFPQRWRLEALYEDGELDGEICETVPLRTSAVVGRQRLAAQEDAEDEQLIELEVNPSLGPKEASKLYGDVQDQHCRLHRMGNDFYVMALESQIGTLVDGQKIRHQDGPVPIRDGTTLGIGKYLVYCEVGNEAFLQDRRRKLLAGERFWKEGKASLQKSEEAAEAKPAAEEGEAAQAGEGADDDEEDEEALDVLFTAPPDEAETDGVTKAEAAATEDADMKPSEEESAVDRESKKRKREE